MGGFDKPVSGKEQVPHEWLQVSPVEREKKEKEPFTSVSSPSLLLASLLIHFREALSEFLPKGKSAQWNIADLIDNLNRFLNSLQILFEKDESHNPLFTGQLAENWHHLQENSHDLFLNKQELTDLYPLLQTFFDKIETFPPSSDLSLAYYLKEYAGKEWLPFPFMEMLQELHDQAALSPHNCYLKEWIDDLSSLISLLNERKTSISG